MATKKDQRNTKHGTDPKTRPMRWEYDILAKDFIPRQHPHPVPQTGILDEELYCLKFNVMWIPHIIGALQLLLEKDSWSGGDDEVFRAQQAILLMLENLNSPCDSGELNMRTPEFRSIVVDENCDQNQWKYVDEPESAWRNLGTPTCDGEDGVGTPGEDGREIEIQTVSAGENCVQIQYRYQGETEWIDSGEPICCDCEETVPPNPTEPVDESGLYCSIAINIAAELHRIYNQSYEDVDDLFQLATGVGGLATGIAALLFPGIAVGVAVVSGLASFITFLKSVIEGGELNAFDATAEEQFRCDLYCILVAHDTTEITAEIIEEWAVKIEEYTIMGEQRFAASKLLREAPLEAWQWLAYASSEVDPAACDCECCPVYEYTIPANLGVPNGYATGLMISIGDVITFDCDPADTWDIGDGTPRNADGSGTFNQQNYVDPTTTAGKLICRIGASNNWFSAGVHSQITSSFQGEMFFMCNDIIGDHGNNSGDITVTVTVCPA